MTILKTEDNQIEIADNNPIFAASPGLIIASASIEDAIKRKNTKKQVD